MSVAEFSIYFDNTPADAEQIDLFNEIKVDQAIGMAAECELSMDIGMDENGSWNGMEDDFTQAFSRVRIEIKIRDGEFVPLIDGPIVGQKFNLSASPDSSKLVLIVQDDSVLLNQEEQVTVFEDKTPDEIAQTLFQQYGLTSEVDTVALSSGGLTRYNVQRGTAMQFLRDLARRHGMFVYVKPDDTPGSSIGVFKLPSLDNEDLPELLLIGADRNINNFSARFDGLRPLKARADNVDITNQELLTSETEASDIDPQGDTTVHDMIEAGETLLARTGAESADLDAATVAAVNHSSWAYSANAEVMADNYGGILSPYQTITVTGAGGYLSGDWLISHVSHVINFESYKQQFTLRRNARSDGTGGSGIGGGIF